MADITALFGSGASGSNLLTSDAGDATPFSFTQSGFGSGSHKYDNTVVLNGPLSCKVVNGGDNSKYFGWNLPSSADHYGRFYLYKTTTGACAIAQATPDGANRNARIDVGTFITIYDAPATGNLTGAVPVALNNWIRIEYHIIHSATVGQIEVKLFNNMHSQVPSEVITSPATWNTGINCFSMNLGEPSTSSGGTTYWLDAIVVNATSYPGPFLRGRLMDSFSRSVTDGWGTSDSGHNWTNQGTAANIDVNGSRGTINIASGNAAVDTDVGFYYFNSLFKFTHDSEAVGNLNRLNFTFRNGLYYVQLENNGGGPISYTLRPALMYSIGPTAIATTTDLVVPIGEQWYCRTIVYPGGLITAALWKVGDPEPAPQLSAIISDSKQGAGDSTIPATRVGISAGHFSTNDMAATVDDIDIIDLSTSAAYAPRSGSSMVRG